VEEEEDEEEDEEDEEAEEEAERTGEGEVASGAEQGGPVACASGGCARTEPRMRAPRGGVRELWGNSAVAAGADDAVLGAQVLVHVRHGRLLGSRPPQKQGSIPRKRGCRRLRRAARITR
jgi:hypothetical protein